MGGKVLPDLRASMTSFFRSSSIQPSPSSSAVLDTFSYLNNSGTLEKANFTIDRIEVTVTNLVDDGDSEVLP